MKLNEEEKNKVVESLSSFLRKPCSVCRGKSWILNETIFELCEFQGGNLVTGSKSSVFPVFVVSCESCGHTHCFNAILLGLIEKNHGRTN